MIHGNEAYLQAQAAKRREATMTQTQASRQFQLELRLDAELRAMPASPTYPGESCLQCGEPAQVKHNDLRFDEISYWCDEHWDDVWWFVKTYRELREIGRVTCIADAIQPTDEQLQSQLEGWPN